MYLNRGVLLEPPEQRWVCPNCDLEDVTHHTPTDDQAISRMHNCRGLHGLNIPMVAAGTRAKIEQKDREDYIGRDVVQTDLEGRPVMAAVTTRDDGEDCTVYAPSINLSLRSL